MNLNRLRPEVLRDLVEYVMENESSVKRDELAARYVIEHMSEREAFETWLNWNGIIGYTETIINALDSIRNAQGEPFKPGDRVQFTEEFLRTRTQADMARVEARGRVAKVVHIQQHGTNRMAARLQWADGSESGALLAYLELAHG